MECLPHVKVAPDDLAKYIEDNKDNKDKGKKIVISTFTAKDLVRLKNPDG